jgi:flavin reductase (DIM6/NTAB) family NADH-FMN oxidoreductase RutF
VTEALAWLDCVIEARLETGDRTVYLAAVLAGELVRDRPVLTVKRMVDLAPADKLRQLKDALARDGQIDAQAIRAWRLARSEQSSLEN